MSIFLGYSDNDMLGKARELPETAASCSAHGSSPPAEKLAAVCAASPLPAPCHVPVRRLQEARCPHSSVLIEESRRSCPPPTASLFLLSSVSTADEAQEAEAIRILTSVLNIRESTSDKAPRKTIFVLKILVMLYYLMMNYSKASFPRKAACLKWR